METAQNHRKPNNTKKKERKINIKNQQKVIETGYAYELEILPCYVGSFFFFLADRIEGSLENELLQSYRHIIKTSI